MVAGPQIRQYAIDQSAVVSISRWCASRRVRRWRSPITVVVAPAMALFLGRTPARKIHACRCRQIVTSRQVSGIDVDRIGAYVWLLAGGLAGLGGIMFAAVQGAFDPNLGFEILFLIFTTVVLGRHRQRLRRARRRPRVGPRDGAFDLERVLPAGSRPASKPILAFLALIALLLYRPQGLFGRARIL